VGTLVALAAAYFLGVDPRIVLDIMGGAPTQVEAPPFNPRDARPSRADDELADFVSVVLADTEDTWSALFATGGRRYQPPTLVLFSDSVQSACGVAGSATGPFYCPGDQRLYIDLGFYRQLREQFRAPGDFAQAYVIAHEVGHHVQNLTGTMAQVQRAAGADNRASIQLELQADCYAGIWGHHAENARSILEEGDIEEGLRAAAAVGDDAIQQRTQGHVVPDSFTHGSSEQRVAWFRRGMESGSVDACDTFSAAG
jgi:predicted metalloprotease